MDIVVQTAHSPISLIEPIVALLIIATFVGIIADRIKVPYTVLLMMVGILLSLIGLVPRVDLTEELLMEVFLPALLFEAAIHFPSNELRKFAPTIAMLAAPGVILTAIATALVLTLEVATFKAGASMSFMHYLLFGTIIAATDPIAVIALFKQLGVKRKISVVLEGESLFNDGTAIVSYTVVLTALTSGVVSFSDGAMLFVTEALFGVTLGAIIGTFAYFTLRFATDPLITIALTTVTAYGSFLVADSLNASGVLATATAGLFLGNMGKKTSMEPSNRIAVVSFWRYVSFFISSIVFLLIGLKVNVPFLLAHTELILYAFLAVLASRAISVFLPLGLLHRLGQSLTIKAATAIWWGGLRGSLSMVLVLSIPNSIAGKDAIIAMTFGVVVLSVIFQGLTMGPVVRALGLVEKRSEAMKFMAQNLARLRALYEKQRVLARLNREEGFSQTQILSEKINQEKNNILNQFKEKEKDIEFLTAKDQRIKYIESYLNEVEENSLRESAEKHLITEEDFHKLIKSQL